MAIAAALPLPRSSAIHKTAITTSPRMPAASAWRTPPRVYSPLPPRRPMRAMAILPDDAARSPGRPRRPSSSGRP